jgi:hypothetical protein
VRARQFFDLMVLTNGARLQVEGESAGELDLVLLAEEMKLLLSRGSAKAALDLFRATISGRVPRYDSVLYPVHVRAIAQSGDLDTAVGMALQALDRLERAGKTGSARYEELLLLCCQVTRAQHAAKAGTLRLALRRALRRAVEPVPGGKLVQRFMKVDFRGSKPVSVLRLSIALLELLDVEAAGRSDVDPGGADQAHMCASRGLDALRKLGPDYFSVDGGLLVRSAAWLSAHCASAPEVRQLLDVPQVMAILHRDYGNSLKAYFANREGELPAELVARLGGETVEPSAGFEAGTVTEDQQGAIGAALRVVIQARDTAQGSHFN